MDGDVRFRYTGTLDLTSLFTGQGLACLCQDLTGHGIDHRLSQCLTSQTQTDCQLLIILIAAYPGHIVPSGVEEQVVQMGLGTLHRRRLTGTQLAVYFQQAVLYALGSILLNGGTQGGIIAEQTQDLLIGTDTQRTDKGGDGQLAVLVDADIEHIIGVGFVFQPRAAVGDNSGGKQFLTGLVTGRRIVYTRRTNQLRYNDTLGAVDDKGTAVSHQREIAHIDVLLLYFAG